MSLWYCIRKLFEVTTLNLALKEIVQSKGLYFVPSNRGTKLHCHLVGIAEARRVRFLCKFISSVDGGDREGNCAKTVRKINRLCSTSRGKGKMGFNMPAPSVMAQGTPVIDIFIPSHKDQAWEAFKCFHHESYIAGILDILFYCTLGNGLL